MNGPSPSVAAAPGAAAAAAVPSHSAYDKNGRFMLYDEKVHINGKYAYDSKRPEVWLSDVRDYIAGRTRELDPLLLWLENCSDEVDDKWAAAAYPGCMDVLPPMEEISRQLWSFLGPLVKDNNDKAAAFRNVPRHNGLEAWRRITEPINDDKAAMRRELLPKINNPKGAKAYNEIEQRLEEWNTDCRLMIENGGKAPDDEARRLAFCEMLPSDMSTYALMRLETDPEFSSFAKVKKWALRYAKLQQLQTRKTKGVNVVDIEKQQAAWEPLPAAESGETEDGEAGDWIAEQQELLDNMRENGVSPDAQAVVLAVMRGRFMKLPGQGQRQPFRPRANQNRPGMPPRGVQDLSCVNCGEKGHMAGNCPKPQITDKSKRPCFVCKKIGCKAATRPQAR